MKISIGKSSKRYKHTLNRDVNTSFPFGVTQPIFSQLLTPDSDISVHSKQLVRLAPMVCPSFARVGLYTVTRFVPLVDIFPAFDCLLSRSPYRGAVPTQVPTVQNALLVYYALCHSNFNVFVKKSDGLWSEMVGPNGDSSLSPSTLSEVSDHLWKIVCNNTAPSGALDYVKIALNGTNFINSVSNSPYRVSPTFENADYVVFDSNYPNYAYTFTFGSWAKNFRNICVGLGYSFDLDDYDSVSLLPLLAYFKAWYDTYGLQRDENFTNTACYKFIYLLDSLGSTPPKIDVTTISNKFNANIRSLYSFFDELSNCYFTTPDDFVSLHRSTMQTAPENQALHFVNAQGQTSSVQNIHENDVTAPPTTPFGNITLKALQVFSRYINKQSVIGRNISEWMRVHYGSSVVNTVFNNSNHVDSSYLPFEINDVFSTSDTAQVDSNNVRSGENLGAYAGKGIGFGNLSFKYHAPCHGYIITLAAVASDSGYFQGNDMSLFGVDFETLPNADFDALGMEVTHRSSFVDHNSISNRAVVGASDVTNKGFGFIPRYSGFKVSKNVVNGDMSRRGTIDSLCPYYLDRILTTNSVTSSKDPNGKYKLSVIGSTIPSSSYNWRILGLYPWLGNFDRIFINDVGDLVKGSTPNRPFGSDYYSPQYFCIDDHYLSQNIFDVTLTNNLKPLSLSFDTFEESTDNASVDVNPE